MVSKENNKPNANDVSYKNAKVVLLGDSGVGKTALGIALTGQPFTLTEPTHGRNIWLLDHSIIHFDDGREETREILLWDFAGQPGYRLINQLYLNNVDIALVVFDAFAETDPLASVRYWNDALNIAQRLENRSPRSLRKFLISVRMDRGSRSFSHSSIDALVRELGCDDYFETSAKEGRGIAELSGSIRETIDWQAITAVQSVQLFQQVATFLNVEKDTSQVLTAEANLYNMFLKSQRDLTGTIELKANFATCIQRAETQGLVQKLAFANLVLLRPELIDIHTSALLNAVRDNPNELGSIAEESVRARNSFVAEDEHLQDQEQEKLFITALIEEFLRREIALREQSEDGPYLIFPSLVSRVAPDLPEPEGKTTIFNFEGPVLNIYTTLIVRLSHHQMFKKPRFWRNAAIYTARAGGTCGILLRSLSEEHGELTLFFDKKASEETRFTFEDFVKTHLMPRAVPSTIQRKRIFMCSTCGTRLDDLQVTRRQERGFNWIICNVCDTIVSILDAEDRLDIVPSSRSLVLEMDPIADSKRDREIIESIVQGKREIGDFDVFLYCNSQDRSAVKQIARQLMTRGILPWFDEWEVRPGQAWQHQVQRQIEQIK